MNNMRSPIAQLIYNAGQNLKDVSGAEIAPALNESLNCFLGSSFRAVNGSVRDSQGGQTGVFDTVISAISPKPTNAEFPEFSADSTACVIAASEMLNLEGFKAAYDRISKAKTLKKAPLVAKESNQQINATMGIIFTIDSSVPVEMLTEELGLLNTQTPSLDFHGQQLT